MENASRALIMAASVLLGIMIISVGVALFTSFGNSGAQIMDNIEKNKIAEFNNQFLKYYGLDMTAHDVVTIANLAKKCNIENDVDDESGYDSTGKSGYIQIDVDSQTNFQNKSEDDFIDFIKDNYNDNGEPKPFIIKEEPKLNKITKRVVYIKIGIK